MHVSLIARTERLLSRIQAFRESTALRLKTVDVNVKSCKNVNGNMKAKVNADLKYDGQIKLTT